MTTGSTDTSKPVLAALRKRAGRTAFVMELGAELGRDGADLDRTLDKLESEGRVLVRSHVAPDPHLVGVDLRVAGLVDEQDGGDPISSAVERVEATWQNWLAEYLANHRCT